MFVHEPILSWLKTSSCHINGSQCMICFKKYSVVRVAYLMPLWFDILTPVYQAVRSTATQNRTYETHFFNRQRSSTDFLLPQVEEDILNNSENNTNLSIQSAAPMHNVSHSSIHQTLKENVLFTPISFSDGSRGLPRRVV